MRKKIIIIGSGFGGLSAACRLAARGNQVQIFEKLDKPGGCAYNHRINGFTFDGGPSIITAPHLFDQIFEMAGKKTEDYFKLVPVHPSFRIFNEDANYFEYSNDLKGILQEIEKHEPDDKENYRRYISSTRDVHVSILRKWIDNPFNSVFQKLKFVPNLINLQSQRSLYHQVSRFIKNHFLRQVFSFHPLLGGGNPLDTSSFFSTINNLNYDSNILYPIGGMGTVVSGFVKLLLELGGKIECNQEIREIVIKGKRATGIRLSDGRVINADIVVSNADVAHTYRHLIPEKYRRKFSNARIDNFRYSISLFVIYFGTKQRYRNSKLAHHNVILTNRFEGLIEDLFKHKILADDFFLFLHMPSLTDPSIAPEGYENFCVISPVPNLDANLDWEQTARRYRDRIMAFLEENYLPDLRSNIVVEHYMDPCHFKDSLNSYKGTAYSFEPVITQSAWFRPRNRSEEFDNLYFVGAGTHPGAGLPGVLTSAKIVESLIESG